jgi:hypothetical protein
MLNAQQIESIADFVQQQGPSEETIAALRETYSDCHFTYCIDDDMGAAKPYMEKESFNIYLVDSRDHCAALTTDDANASGLVIAEVLE